MSETSETSDETSEIKEFLQELKSIPEDKRTGNDSSRLEYYEELLSQEVQSPNMRNLQRQVKLLSLCPFDSNEYKTEMMNLFEVRLDERDKEGNRVRWLEKIGNFTAPIEDEVLLDKVFEKLKKVVKNDKDLVNIVYGFNNHLGSALNKTKIRPKIKALKIG